MNSYYQFVTKFTALFKDTFVENSSAPLASLIPEHTYDPSQPKAFIFAPHPDDECITGGLPLRLMQEKKINVTTVPITLGSNKERQHERAQELERACSFMRYTLRYPQENSFEKVHRVTRKEEPTYWNRMVSIIADLLKQEEPQLIFFPHAYDYNTTHIGTNFLVRDALASLPKQFRCLIIETEYWYPLRKPNLMVELAPEHVAHLMQALSLHKGEVLRNPYHLYLPSWLQDNVRRGSEVIKGQGKAAVAFNFAMLYRIRLWEKSRLKECMPPHLVSCADTFDTFLNAIKL